MASDPTAAVALYILGLRKFSMSPSAAPFVFDKLTKLKSIDTTQTKMEILKSQNSEQVRGIISKLNL